MMSWIFVLIHTFCFFVISSNIHRFFNNIFHEFKALDKFITTETFNDDFHYKLIKFWIIYFFILFTSIYIHGAFNKFLDFFVQAFKIVVYSWKFSMLLLYILWDD